MREYKIPPPERHLKYKSFEAPNASNLISPYSCLPSTQVAAKIKPDYSEGKPGPQGPQGGLKRPLEEDFGGSGPSEVTHLTQAQPTSPHLTSPHPTSLHLTSPYINPALPQPHHTPPQVKRSAPQFHSAFPNMEGGLGGGVTSEQVHLHTCTPANLHT